jgi:hypothetical protein
VKEEKRQEGGGQRVIENIKPRKQQGVMVKKGIPSLEVVIKTETTMAPKDLPLYSDHAPRNTKR